MLIKDAYKNTDLKYIVANNGIKSDIILNKSGHPISFSFPIKTIGCDIKVEDNSLLYLENDIEVGRIPSPYAIDLNGNKGKVNLSYDKNNVFFTIDEKWLNSAIYPIIIDPTTLQVGAGADDGYVWDNTTFFGTANWLLLGDKSNAFARWTNVTVPQGATISSAKVQYKSNSTDSGTTCATKIYFNDEDNASAPTTVATYNSKSVTTAYVDWTIPAWTADTW
ncbi:MAG: hypothetical protein PHF54_03350, partial [Candidatus Pacebacteria bacterium]|nr:hypothetical protein [Candidatus Paceibacterota bacterium]